jgi:uncharacterized membrane protein
MNSRNLIIDNLRGFAFILMIIHHINYFYNITKNNYSNNAIIENIGSVSRYIYIFLVGYSLVYSYTGKDFNKFIQDRFKKSFEILCHAFLITLITYYYYPDKYIRFGILHFIGIITILFAFIMPYKNLYYILLFLIIFIGTQKIPRINNFIDTIIGNSQYNMMDYFSLIKWAPLVLIGIIIKSHDLNLEKIFDFNIFNSNNILTWFGQNSLNLYTIHVFILIILFNYFI